MGRRVMDSEIHSSRKAEHLVEDQSRQNRRSSRAGPHEGRWSRGNRPGKRERSMGSSVRLAQHSRCARRFPESARQEPQSHENFRDAQQAESLRHSLANTDGEERRDSKATHRTVHRNVEGRKNAALINGRQKSLDTGSCCLLSSNHADAPALLLLLLFDPHNGPLSGVFASVSQQ